MRYMKDSKYRIYLVAIKVRELIAKLLYILFYIDNPYTHIVQTSMSNKEAEYKARKIHHPTINRAMYRPDAFLFIEDPRYDGILFVTSDETFYR